MSVGDTGIYQTTPGAWMHTPACQSSSPRIPRQTWAGSLRHWSPNGPGSECQGGSCGKPPKVEWGRMTEKAKCSRSMRVERNKSGDAAGIGQTFLPFSQVPGRFLLMCLPSARSVAWPFSFPAHMLAKSGSAASLGFWDSTWVRTVQQAGRCAPWHRRQITKPHLPYSCVTFLDVVALALPRLPSSLMAPSLPAR